MSRLRGFWSALVALVARGREEREMEEELRFHLERSVEANVSAGMTLEEARRAAARAFGGVDRFKEEVRDARGGRVLEDVARDVAYGLRSIRRNPVFSTVVVLTLGLGMGATTAIFSVVNGVLLDPLPYPAPERLISVWGRFLPESGFDFPQFSLSGPEYFDYAAENRTMESVAAYSSSAATLVRDDATPELVQGAAVTANLFSVLGVSPALGRGFTAEEDAPDGARVAVVSDGLWRRAFGADPGLVGREIRLSGRATRVVGVMPPGFAFPDERREVWIPLRLDPADPGNRQGHTYLAIARLRGSATLEQAETEMATLMARWKETYPEIHTGHFLFLRPLLDDAVGGVRTALLVLMGAVGFVLLIVCANVANLMLARGESRQREVAVRSALGAARGRVARQFLTESVLLGALGAGLGLGLAYVGVRAILALGANSVPRASNVMPDWRVASFALLLGVVASALFGIVPAMRAITVGPLASLRAGGRTGTSGRSWSRFRAALVAGQVALAFLLVICAGLTIRSFRALIQVDSGIESENVLVATVGLPSGAYPDTTSILAFHSDLSERWRALPGVRSVTGLTTLPVAENPPIFDFTIQHRPPPATGQPRTSGHMIAALPGLGETLGIAVAEGRLFMESDRAGTLPVALVNRTAARIFWPGESPVGQRLMMSGERSDTTWLTIVGVIDDVKFAGLDSDTRPAWYVPLAQTAGSLGYAPRTVNYALRGSADAAALSAAARAALREADPELPMIRLQPLGDAVAQSVAEPRFVMVLLGIFGGLALILGAIGLYGVLSYTVAQRSRELGIRIALGARVGQTAGLIVRHAMFLSATGILLGGVLAYNATRLLSGLLFGVSPTDGGTFAVVAIVLLASALAACAAPAIRAMRVDPIRLLRGE